MRDSSSILTIGSLSEGGGGAGAFFRGPEGAGRGGAAAAAGVADCPAP